MEAEEQFKTLAEIEDLLRKALRGEHTVDEHRDFEDRALYLVEGAIEEISKHW